MPNYRSPGVYVEEVQSGSRPIEGVGTATAAFVGVTARGPFDTPVKVSNWGQYVASFGDWVDGAYTPHSIFNYFNNGGGSAYVVRIGGDGDASKEPARATAELTSAAKSGLGAYRIEARETGSPGDGISVEVLRDAPTPPASGGGEGEQRPAPSADNEDTFSVIVRQGETEERYDNVTTKRGPRNLSTVLQASRLVQAVEIGSASVAERVPSSGVVALRGGAALPARLAAEDYIGDSAARTGLGGLSTLEDVTMIAVPDLMTAYEQGHIDLKGVQAVQQSMISHCESMQDRMAILDTPRGMNAQQVQEWVLEGAKYDSKFAALYWPWCEFFDPSKGEARLMPPSGAVAGIWGRNDDTRGVHKAPANEIVQGALDLEINITRPEHDDLNPIGVNVIRAFPGRGIRVWGARTLASDSDWRYVNVRRLFNYIEASILAGTQWVVFEPNDLELWQRIRRTVQQFLLGLWRDGALFGATPDQAFYVKCDAETNPPDVVDAGQVVIEIGIAPVKPAEFVVFRIQQLPSGGGVSE
jgi:phage tail sheath protein FI